MLAYNAEFWKDRSVKLLQELTRDVKVKLTLFVFSVCIGVLLCVCDDFLRKKYGHVWQNV